MKVYTVESSPYQSPSASEISSGSELEFEYVGFWSRVGATIIDLLVIMVIIGPILTAFYGEKYWSDESGGLHGMMDFLLSVLFPAVATVVFWIFKQATPGKLVIQARIVSVETLQPATSPQLIGRYLAYIIAMLPCCLGLVWVGIDRRKQGWHDKLSGTCVIRARK
jgi:uncharacterized RDD family membrane protein YckC